MQHFFSIYRSSAGSGKTHTLAREYLRLALRFRADYFKHILAVTFTNKASQEMKDRILAYLDDFARGKENELAKELKRDLGYDDQTFRQHCQEVQSAILHQYSGFAISTIDAFFQRVIRSFTREAGVVGDYRLEVEHDAVLAQVIDNLVDELGQNPDLTDWVVEFARENLENERAWDVRYNLIEFAREIFREEFKEIEDDMHTASRNPEFFRTLRQRWWGIKQKFITCVSEPARQALALIEAQPWSFEDFSYGRNSGLAGFFQQFAFERTLSTMKQPGERIYTYFRNPANWPNKKTTHAREIVGIAGEKLVPAINQILEAWEEGFEAALSAEQALSNLYVYGLITDIARKLKEYKDENNIMLLADAPKFLNGVIQDSDTPFIYEKVGSFYRNYLIDEFQDTSGMQWKNFRPLIVNSLDQGYPALVVGDVKQAIYRWRGGDLNLLQHQIASHVGNERVVPSNLDKNYRSAPDVVEFNNTLFQEAARHVSLATGAGTSLDAYEDVVQHPARDYQGYVRISFIKEDPEAPDNRRWTDHAFEEIARALEELQLSGVGLNDVAILVRKNEEGQRIASWLHQYRSSPEARSDCHYDVISNESLRIDGAASVNLLLGAMRYLLNTDDAVARAQLAFEYGRMHQPDRELPAVFSVTNQVFFENNLPPGFTEQKLYLTKLPLVELAETLISVFSLGNDTGELVYLQAFVDLILEFSSRERNDLAAFLEWWDDNRHKRSVQIAGDVEAAQILTVHKSKGLQFKYVIVPFCSWGLDHDSWQAPNLWVRSGDERFRDAGYLPVKYGKVLERTFFSSYYTEEKTKTYLDNLNLLYVAFTRAERGLIVTAPHPDVRQAKNTVAELLFNSMTGAHALKEGWKHAGELWTTGKIQADSCDKPVTETMSLQSYLTSAWRDKLAIRQTGKTWFGGFDGKTQRTRYGIHMHAVLSRIRYADEIESALRDLLYEGLVLPEEMDTLRGQLTGLINMPDIARWFSREWEVRTEVPVILPGGRESRMDRFIFQGKRGVVIDFKTGERKKDHQQQVLDYMNTLRLMNFVEVSGFLLYLDEREVFEVAGTTNLKTRGKSKSNTDQLSLGL